MKKNLFSRLYYILFFLLILLVIFKKSLILFLMDQGILPNPKNEADRLLFVSAIAILAGLLILVLMMGLAHWWRKKHGVGASEIRKLWWIGGPRIPIWLAVLVVVVFIIKILSMSFKF